MEFYFDFTSPNAYCGYVQARCLQEDYEFSLKLKPVFLAGIMKELETTPPAMQNEAKANYLYQDIERWTNYYDIPFNFPPEFPMDTLRALRGFLVLEDREKSVLHEYTSQVFEAAWVDEESIDEDSILRECIPTSVQPGPFFEGIEEPEVKEDLKKRTDEALERGVFGCPMIYLEDEPFWGKDRFQIIEDRLNR